MRLNELIDWSFLRRDLLWLAASLVVAALVLAGGQWFLETARDSAQRQESNLVAEREAYFEAENAKRLQQTYATRFAALRRGGVIDEEQRLNWIEQLQHLADRYQIPFLQYNITAQGAFSSEYTQQLPGNVQGSQMVVRMRLLHEGDFASFLQQLRQQAQGLFWVRQCTLRRIETRFEYAPGKGNLAAECELTWLTVATMAREVE